MKTVTTTSLLLGSLALLASCGSTAPSRFFVLTSAESAVDAPASGPVVRVGPVEFPMYLDGPQMVTRRGTNELSRSEYERWAEPLKTNFVRTLAKNLAGDIPTQRIILEPWEWNGPIDFHVGVAVYRFDVDAAGAAVLEGVWRLDSEPPLLETFWIRDTAAGTDPAARVDALSRTLAELSVKIAAAIRAAGGGS